MRCVHSTSSLPLTVVTPKTKAFLPPTKRGNCWHFEPLALVGAIAFALIGPYSLLAHKASYSLGMRTALRYVFGYGCYKCKLNLQLEFW